MTIIGIDLATMKGKTCLCLLRTEPQVYLINKICDIIYFVNDINPGLVTIDAPLYLQEKKSRKEEQALRQLGISVLPPNMPGMLKLTRRAIKLKKGIKTSQIFEVYPYATKKLLSIDLEKNDINDAYICALTGRLYLQGKTATLGASLIIPG
ncbi:MAG: DUF429 domain-containing protein [Candidatus Marinimicrobia bacterium]|nr:DUF429 domain-containing protein [Candidatus Neomarinimicrobiota bacterium]